MDQRQSFFSIGHRGPAAPFGFYIIHPRLLHLWLSFQRFRLERCLGAKVVRKWTALVPCEHADLCFLFHRVRLCPLSAAPGYWMAQSRRRLILYLVLSRPIRGDTAPVALATEVGHWANVDELLMSLSFTKTKKKSALDGVQTDEL